MKDMLDLYDNIVDKTRYMTNRSLPLHRKLKNVYKQKIVFQVEIKKLKTELQPFKEHVAKRKLDILAKVATRRSTKKRRIHDTISH